MDDPVSNRQCRRTGHFIRNGIKDGECSPFKQTAGNHLGYNSVRINIKKPEGPVRAYYVSAARFRFELLKHNAVDDSIENVFSGEMTYGLALPNGAYLFELTGFDPDIVSSMQLNIRKE